MSITFRADVERIGERLVVRLPDEASGALPSRGQVAVEALVNGHPWATVVEPDGRRGHWIAVNEQLQHGLSLEDGDPVDVELVPTKAWPEPQLPEDFAAGLADAPDLAGTWTEITPMARWEWVRWVNATRNPQTRERRIEASISKMRGGTRRPCCFDTAACTDPELSRSGKLVEPGRA
jgi:hypothetical protein